MSQTPYAVTWTSQCQRMPKPATEVPLHKYSRLLLFVLCREYQGALHIAYLEALRVMQKICIGLTVKDRAYEGLGVLVDLLLRAVGAEHLVKLVQLACAAARIVDGQLALLAYLTAACQHRHNPKSMPRSSNGACTYWWLLQDMCS